MNKILYFITLLFLVSSCNNEDVVVEEPAILQCGNVSFNYSSKIVGKWKYESHLENNIQITDNDCQAKTLEIYNSGDTELLKYGNISGNCNIIESIYSTLLPELANPLSDIYYEYINNSNSSNNYILKTFTLQNNANQLTIVFENLNTSTNQIVNYVYYYSRI